MERLSETQKWCLEWHVFFRCLCWHVSTQKGHVMLLWHVLPTVYTGLDTPCCLSASWGQRPRCGTAHVPFPGLLSYGPISGSRWPSWSNGGACCSLTKWPWLFSSQWCGFPFCSALMFGFPPLLFLLLLMWLPYVSSFFFGVLFFHLLNDPPVSLIYVLMHYRHSILYIWQWIFLTRSILSCHSFVCGFTGVLMWYFLMVLWMRFMIPLTHGGNYNHSHIVCAGGFFVIFLPFFISFSLVVFPFLWTIRGIVSFFYEFLLPLCCLHQLGFLHNATGFQLQRAT